MVFGIFVYRVGLAPRLLGGAAALVLVFIGGKMLAMPWFHMPVQWSLLIVATIILISVVLSLTLSSRKPARSAL